MAECGAQNIYLLQNPASPPPPHNRNRNIRAPHSAYAHSGTLKFSDGNRENLPFQRPRRSRQYWTLKSTYQPDFFFWDKYHKVIYKFI
jgi:hypothetical protein